jgi:hypothetical protein
MNTKKKQPMRQGIALIAAMIFIIVFSAISIGFLSLSSANTQISANHRASGKAMNASLSGMDCARYLLTRANTAYKNSTAYTNSKTLTNTISATEANTLWTNIYTQLCTQLASSTLGATSIAKSNTAAGAGYIIISGVKYQNPGSTFSIEYRHFAGETNIYITCTGTDGSISRTTTTSVEIAKPKLNYGFAGRGRVWLAGDTTIYGDVYSSYGYKSNGSMQSMSPFNMTADSTVDGKFYTILSKDEIDTANYYQFETLDGDGNPTYIATDELQGEYDGIDYDISTSDFAGMSISDYDTSSYKSAIPTTVITAAVAAGSSLIQNCTLSKSSTSTVTEYFPHASNSYTTRASNSSLPLKRYIYDGKTIKNVTVSAGENALFRNCTFEGVLYVNCNTSGPTVSLPSSYTTSAINTFLSTTKNYNNIRFEGCTFNGTIITNTPQSLNTNWWVGNSLYFTGTATFQNNSGIQEATILAPHFNVNLGNTNADTGVNGTLNNTLTGAIVGGIVDIRGNADIYGTIISMADTSSYSSGYVSNIGATLADGGSETININDIGKISVTPNVDGKLPYGIKTPVVLDMNTSAFTANYNEK